jgi:hypothetical protein
LCETQCVHVKQNNMLMVTEQYTKHTRRVGECVPVPSHLFQLFNRCFLTLFTFLRRPLHLLGYNLEIDEFVFERDLVSHDNKEVRRLGRAARDAVNYVVGSFRRRGSNPAIEMSKTQLYANSV